MVKLSKKLSKEGTMEKNKYILISDTIHGTIKLNELEKRIISTQIFNRLHNVSQNSTVYLTFPTNRTKRFEHSIGTMWLCGKLFQESITNSDDETLELFFANIQCIIDKEIESIDKSGDKKSYTDKYRYKIGDRNLKIDKLKEYKKIIVPKEYDRFIPRNVPNEYISTYTIIFQAVRLSGLLHDVGHPPYSHITEYALKDIWYELNKIDLSKRTNRQKNFIDSMSKYFETKQDLHEQIGNIITAKVLDDIIDKISNEQARESNIFHQRLFEIIVGEMTSGILLEKHKSLGEIHRIIDGTLDGDRLDYVNRDPVNSGLNVGAIEYDRIISGIRLSEFEGCFIFTPSSKIIDSIDDFFNRRWRLYKQIIYHHRAIKTDYLLQDCIKQLAMNYLAKDDIDDEYVNILPYNISGLWKAVKEKASYQEFFDNLIQWDDGWLMTIMKVHYFSEYSNTNEMSELSYKLEELLANKKHYFSLIKRMEDFVKIDESIASEFFKEYNNIDTLLNKIKSNTNSVNEQSVVVEIDPTIKYIRKFLDGLKTKDYKFITRNGFLLNQINKIFSNLFDDDWLNTIIKNSVHEVTDESSDIKDAFAVIKKVKTGTPGGNAIDGGLGIYQINDDSINIVDYKNISNLSSSLQLDIDFMPVFYVYLVKNSNTLKYDALKDKLGKRIALKILDKIKERLNGIAN